jgi:hypothetical protein
MSRKDFIALAQAIGGISDDGERRRVAELIGAVCARHNSAFDYKRWFSACNVAINR